METKKNLYTELDVMVAEKVMGWTKKELPNNNKGLPYTAMYWVNNKGEKERPVNFFNPSTDIQQAIKVAEKFEEWELAKVLPKGKYKAMINNYENVVHSDKPTRAICLACLKAVGVEI